MVSIGVAWVSYQFLLPATLLASVIFRYNIFSSIYLVILLVFSYSPTLTHLTKGKCIKFVVGTLVISLLFLLAQIVFQIALLASQPYGSLAGERCSEKESILRYIGLERLDSMSVADIFRLLLPDVTTFLISLVTFVLFRRITEPHTQQAVQTTAEADMNAEIEEASDSQNDQTRVFQVTMLGLKNGAILFMTMIAMAFAGIANPSLFSGCYLAVFSALMTAWALHGRMLSNRIVGLRVFLSAVTAVDLLLIFYYQIAFFRNAVPPHSLAARLMGLTPFVNTSCQTYPTQLVLNEGIHWSEFISPPLNLILHWMLGWGVVAFMSSDKRKMHKKMSTARRRVPKKDEKRPLVEEEVRPHSYNAMDDEPTTSTASVPVRKDAPNPARKSFLQTISGWISKLKMQSFYVLALIVMMAWSVTLHSWLTLILLIWSCVLWLVKHKAHAVLYCSPFITVYAMALICLQFIYSLNLTEAELPTTVLRADGTTFSLSSFGIQRFFNDMPSLYLGAQILYTCIFWLVLHQFIHIRRHENDIAPNEEPSRILQASQYIREKLSKYWILVVYSFLLVMATEGFPSGIKLIYAFALTCSGFVFELSWNAWRKLITPFLYFLIIYTMVALLLIYTYQFDEFPSYWKSFTNFTDDQLRDLGLEQYHETGELFLRISIPTLFLLTVILQKHYFNDTFLERVSKRVKQNSNLSSRANSPPLGSGDEDSIEMRNLNGEGAAEERPKKPLMKQWLDVFLKYWYATIRLIWRLLEFHVWKLVVITVLVSALQKATAMYFVLFFAWVVFLSLRCGALVVCVMTSAYVGLLIPATMFYQFDFVNVLRDENKLNYSCNFSMSADVSVLGYYNTMDWVGFTSMQSTDSYFYHAQGYISILIMLAFERIVARRQDWRRFYRREIKMSQYLTSLYPSIDRSKADADLLSCCKYLINHWFYKFGVEACYIMAVITIWVRADAVGVFYSILFIVAMLIRKRSSLSKFWKVYAFLLMILLVVEYGAALGMPPIWCNEGHEYPWTRLSRTTVVIRNRLVRWLYLPDYVIPPHSGSLIVDVFQLLFIICQLNVFYFEMKPEAIAHGGINTYLTPKYLDSVTPSTNPKRNFMSKNARNVLDQLKVGVFRYSYWITVIFIFVAGTATISLFCMGYLVAFFYLMTYHQSLFVDKPSKYLRIWNIVLGYNVWVIITKIWLQITSCVYIEVLADKACVFVQLMNLVCSRPDEYQGLTESTVSAECSTPNSYANAGMTWDFVCFLFLIIQRRIFQSFYFLHTSEDMRITLELASRGAELFREKLISEVTTRREAEESNIEQIRDNMTAIRKRYVNIGRGELVTHTDAMRSGDYYMFPEGEEEEEEGAAKEKPDEDIMNPIQLLHAVDTVGIDKALEEREEDKRTLDLDENSDPVPKETLAGRSTEDLVADTQQAEVKEKGKIKKAFVFVWELFLTAVDSLILWLNTANCDYRNVALQLASEKEDLAKARLREQRPVSALSTDIVIDEENGGASVQNGGGNEADAANSDDSSQNFELHPMDFDRDQMRILRLFYAIWYSIISHTDVVCYFLVILNLMLSASVLSLILPLATFLWSTLSTPRPTSRFWSFCIFYLEIVILVKFVFQFEFFPWNADGEANLRVYDPFWWPRIIGIEQKDKWSSLDLAQLLAFFFHKQMLSIYGVWDKAGQTNEDQSEENLPSKTTETVTENEESAPKDVLPAVKVTDGVEDDAEVEDDRDFSRIKRILTSPYRFLYRLLHQRYSAVTDVYIFMFLCDVINFIIIIFGYWAFGKYPSTASDVVTNITSNNVPTGFLVMLIVQFAMMFIDRALYLRKNIVGKLIYHIALVIGVHVWMFFVLPVINERPFYMNHVAQTWYFFKAVYFLLSAYQIRCGYPTRVLGNFLTKAYGTANLFLFKGYRLIPFLAELTAIMDWMFVDTTMGIGEWFKFQAIYAEVFELKCWRVFETNYPSPRATAKSKFIKYFVGGLLVFFLIAIIWFPLLFMNIALTIGGLTNNPTQVSIQVTANTFEPLFQVVADTDSISTWSSSEYSSLVKEFSQDPSAALFLSSFSSSQVVSVNFNGQSKTIWSISPPQRVALLNRLNSSSPNPVTIDFEWTVVRNPETATVVSSTGSHAVQLTSTDPSRAQLYNLLNAVGTEVAPAYIHAADKATSPPATQLYSKNTSLIYVDTNLTIRYDEADNLTSWWRINESSKSADSTASLNIVILSDKVSSSSLSFLVGYGIIGLYVSIVLVVGKFVRSALVGNTNTIMFQELPRVEKVLQICLDIYLVREEEKFQLEEDLYAKLIFLYRSPETMIRKTRPKQD